VVRFMQMSSQVNTDVKSRWGKVRVRLALMLAAGSAFLFLPRCDQGYPIAATLCDEWCAAENRIRCANEVDPAQCVSQCEDMRLFNGRPEQTKCDPARHELVECIKALPDSAFVCDADGVLRRRQGTCLEPARQLSICQSRDSTTWEELCSTWARVCDSIDGGDSWPALYEACTEPYRYAQNSCSLERGTFLDCLSGTTPQCDRTPARDLGFCRTERAALDACDPRFTSICNLWLFECRGVSDASTDGGSPEEYLLAVRACLMSRPIDVGPRCFTLREDLYDCLTGPWYDDHVVRCDITPARAPECATERARFESCAMSSSDGGP
jgi:hypothetical protein